MARATINDDGPPEELASRLREVEPLAVSPGLRTRVAEGLARPDPRSRLWAMATGWRQALSAVGLLALGALLVAVQGIRNDLDGNAWVQFAVAGVPMVGVGLAVAGGALAHRGVLSDGWAMGCGWPGVGWWPGRRWGRGRERMGYPPRWTCTALA